jgi:hypothetical protein
LGQGIARSKTFPPGKTTTHVSLAERLTVFYDNGIVVNLSARNTMLRGRPSVVCGEEPLHLISLLSAFYDDRIVVKSAARKYPTIPTVPMARGPIFSHLVQYRPSNEGSWLSRRWAQ